MNYTELKKITNEGFNTWDTNSVLSHTLLPYGFSIRVGFKDYSTNNILKDVLVGEVSAGKEIIKPGIRSYDGTYTELTLEYDNINVNIQTAVYEDEQYILIKPIEEVKKPVLVFAECCMLWNRPGVIDCNNNTVKAGFSDKTIYVYISGEPKTDYNLGLRAPYIATMLNGNIVISTKQITVPDTEVIIERARQSVISGTLQYGKLSECYQAMRSVLAWDTIYEPHNDAIFSPVSRIWNRGWGGYVLFCWDTFFAAIMIAQENKELAYLNIFGILNEITENGFVPNFGAAYDYKSRDRSQPPVGSMVVFEVYKKYKEKWILEQTFDRLFKWNSWFYEYRTEADSTLCWGSDYYKPKNGFCWELDGVNDRFGAALESGLDNSPMYDDIPFDKTKSMLCLSDVGLSGLYINDCENLAYIAEEIGRQKEKQILLERSARVKEGLNTLWNEEFGMFLNRRTDTGEFSFRISPTNFYALFSNSISNDKVDRMVKEHLLNENEFWGEYVLPSISKSDEAYVDQDYWRGSIWAPMNYLVYLALKKRNLFGIAKDLAAKSKKLLLKEWEMYGHIHENYNCKTGMGCGVNNSDKFYHWGALLALIAIDAKSNNEVK